MKFASGPARCFPEGHKRLCSYTQESCKMCVLCERGALELVILFYREKSTSASGHTQPDHWFPSFADASPQPSTPGLPSRSPPPHTLILPVSPKAYSHSHCVFESSQQHQLTSLFLETLSSLGFWAPHFLPITRALL